MKHWWLYVLQLEDGKFYVGITSKTPEIRMQEHVHGVHVAYWTAKHRPIEIIYRENLGYINRSKAEKRENKMTRALMKQRGVNSVRGGDLRDTCDYAARFGKVFTKDGWDDLVHACAMPMIIALFVLDKCVTPIFPGGIH